MSGRRAILSLWLAGLALSCGLPSSAAFASKLRLLARSTTAFASDGTRYVAWQVHATSAIVVFDTKTGHRGAIKPPEGCQLEDEGRRLDPGWTAAADRFLLRCPSGRDLLAVRTGAVVELPMLLGNIFPPYTLGPPAVGARYLENGAPRRYPPGGSELGTEAACPLSSSERKQRLYCVELYDIATRAVTYRSISRLPDLDTAGAPPICPRLRGRMIKEHEELNGLAYANGVVVEPESRGEAPAIHVRIVHCHGRSTLVRTRGEPQSLDVRGGLFTWDTGRSFFSAEAFAHATLTSYRLATHRRQAWSLPLFTIHHPDGLPASVETGVWGYSSHTSNTVFWIAARTCEATETECEVATSSVYAAHL